LRCAANRLLVTLRIARKNCENMELMMTWKTPKIVEIALGAEINCYACAELNA